MPRLFRLIEEMLVDAVFWLEAGRLHAGAVNDEAAIHGFMRCTAARGQASLLRALHHGRVEVGGDDLIERPAVGAASPCRSAS